LSLPRQQPPSPHSHASRGVHERPTGGAVNQKELEQLHASKVHQHERDPRQDDLSWIRSSEGLLLLDLGRVL